MRVKGGRETLIGAITLGVLVLLLWTNAADRDAVGEGDPGYRVEAIFPRTDGLLSGAEVRLAGIEIGRIVGRRLDDDYRAHIMLLIDPDVRIPQDSAAIIETDGLLGSKYIEIQPGGAEEYLSDGQRIDYTQGSIVIEELLARIVAQAKARNAAPTRPADRDAAAAPADDETDGGASPFPSLLDPMPGSGDTAN